MAQCPVCNADISDDFGLIECPSCSAQLIVHVDGRVEASSGEPESVSPPLESPMIGEELESIPEGEFEPEMEPIAVDAEIAAEPAAEADAAAEAEYSFDQPADAQDPPPQVYAPPPATSASPDLSDVQAFGNSDSSGGREGNLRYNLTLEGIDTSDIREAFREALTDRKFMWDTDQILRSIKHGRVRIENVSPIKAYILITRLRSLPIHVHWEQYAVHQV